MKELAAGGVVHRQGRILLIRDRWGRYAFPKGHLEEGETYAQAALREIEEETGITGTIQEELGDVIYPLSRIGGEAREKAVRYFLVEAQNDRIAVLRSEVADARWYPIEEAAEILQKNGYANSWPLFERAWRILSHGDTSGQNKKDDR